MRAGELVGGERFVLRTGRRGVCVRVGQGSVYVWLEERGKEGEDFHEPAVRAHISLNTELEREYGEG